MKKQLLLLTTLFSIGSLYAMDSQNPDDINPDTNHIALSAPSPLADDQDNSESTHQSGVSFGDMLNQMNSLTETFEEPQPLDSDLPSTSAIKTSKKPITRSKQQERRRQWLNKRGQKRGMFGAMARKAGNRFVDNTTNMVNKAHIARSPIMEKKHLEDAANTKTQSKNRKYALFNLFDQIPSQRTTKYPGIVFAQGQFKRPLKQRSYTDDKLSSIWLENLMYFGMLHESSKNVYDYLKRSNANKGILSILEDRINLMNDTLKPLEKKAKKLDTCTPPTADERLFCELQDAELINLIQKLTAIMKQEDNPSITVAQQKDLHGQKKGIILTFSFHESIGTLVAKLHANQETAQKLYKQLHALAAKKKAKGLSTEEKLTYNESMKTYKKIAAFNKLLFAGIRESFFIQRALKPLENKLRPLENQKRRLNTKRLQASDPEKAQYIAQIAKLDEIIHPLKQEINPKVEWLRFIQHIFNTDTTDTKTTINNFIKAVNPVLQAERDISILSKNIAARQELYNLMSDVSEAAAEKGNAKVKIAELTTKLKTIIAQLKTQKLALKTFITTHP